MRNIGSRLQFAYNFFILQYIYMYIIKPLWLKGIYDNGQRE